MLELKRCSFLVLVFFFIFAVTYEKIESVTITPLDSARDCDSRSKTHVSPDGRIRLLVTRGCSGSSFVVSTLRRILRIQGFLVQNGKSEIYKYHKNPMFEEANKSSPIGTPNSQVVVNATVMLNQLALENGEIMLVKWKDSLVGDIEAKVGRDNVLLGSLVRENVLDQLICSVNDCFHKGKRFGYPVFASNDSKSDLCFGRRREENVKMKTYFDPERFNEMIAFLRRELREVESFKLRQNSQTYEELVAFQYSDDMHVFKTSMEAWASLANKYAVIDDGTIENTLRKFVNTREKSYHEDSIMNYEDVAHALEKAKLGNLIRRKTP